jgi:hypothetical protein
MCDMPRMQFGNRVRYFDHDLRRAACIERAAAAYLRHGLCGNELIGEQDAVFRLRYHVEERDQRGMEDALCGLGTRHGCCGLVLVLR